MFHIIPFCCSFCIAMRFTERAHEDVCKLPSVLTACSMTTSDFLVYLDLLCPSLGSSHFPRDHWSLSMEQETKIQTLVIISNAECALLGLEAGEQSGKDL